MIKNDQIVQGHLILYKLCPDTMCELSVVPCTHLLMIYNIWVNERRNPVKTYALLAIVPQRGTIAPHLGDTA